MTFRIGQQVECISASGMLKKGAVYTVLGIEHGFIEVDCEPDCFGGRCYYNKRFRPVVERKTDISIFTAMLKPEKVSS